MTLWAGPIKILKKYCVTGRFKVLRNMFILRRRKNFSKKNKVSKDYFTKNINNQQGHKSS